jgi:iron complex transport system ATP-binding protein
MSLMQTQSLTIGYTEGENHKVLQRNRNLSISKGEIISLMGQNGVGKTTFIKTITGLHPSLEGDVHYQNVAIEQLSKQTLSKKISVVLNEKPFAANLSVVELIGLGRHPYSNWLGRLSTLDKEAIDTAITQTKINYLANKKLYQLSDGQFQKVMIARALAQDTDLIILDEPTAHLDLNNKIEIMLLLRTIAENGKGILISTHDLQISLQLSDQLWLFNFNKPVRYGCPEDLILQGAIEQTLFPVNDNIDLRTGTVKQLTATNGAIRIIGDESSVFWTSQALHRNGFSSQDTDAEMNLNCHHDGTWHFSYKGELIIFEAIEQLLSHLKTIIKVARND